MKKNRNLILLSALSIAVTCVIGTKAFASADSVDCSVASTRECTRVDVPGGTTVIHYGKAKTPPPSEP